MGAEGPAKCFRIAGHYLSVTIEFAMARSNPPSNRSGGTGGFSILLEIYTETGELELAIATSKEFKIKHRAQVVGETTRSYPVIADGFACIKGPRQLVCVNLRANQSAKVVR